MGEKAKGQEGTPQGHAMPRLALSPNSPPLPETTRRKIIRGKNTTDILKEIHVLQG
jgi:hypothetical protein